jgi:lon-related putative ATP-dependent protease
MKPKKALEPAKLYTRCDPRPFKFDTTEQLEDLSEVLGQPRAVDAIEFGIKIQREGYNLYAMGPAGSGKHSIVRRFLDSKAVTEPVPPDLCYVHNFAEPSKPRAVNLPAGVARKFCASMNRLVEDLRTAIPAAFETDEYRARRQEIDQELNDRQEKAFAEIRVRAKKQNIALLRTPGGLAFAPAADGEVLEPEKFNKLPKSERERIESAIAAFQEEVEKVIHHVPKWRRELHHKIRELNRQITKSVVDSQIEELKKEYGPLPDVQTYLTDVQQDLIEHADDFRQPREGEKPMLFGIPLPLPDTGEPSLRRYSVNVLIDHGESKGAPVIYEDNPTYQNLVGRIEHVVQMGALMTDFSLIKPGALHRANGGYLLLDALKLLLEPYAWDGLKRALRSREIRIESLGQKLGVVSTVSLEPEPIELKTKVVLLGDRLLYYLLYQFDPEFADLFKVEADFDESMDRSPKSNLLYARLIATLLRQEKLRPFDRAAVARVIEQSARVAGDAEKLSVQMRGMIDLLREADYWADTNGHKAVTASDVQRAIDAQDQRADRLRDRLQEEIQRGTILIDTSGEKPGQVNGLSVLQLGGFSFGHPSRITARVRMGSGRVVDIERETKLGGPIHSKGVLILSGFLAGRYVPDQPLSLSASLVFEQSYGGVEGDSASSAELYALLSALADVPIKQSFAVTGSVNQRGDVQAIGGVNEKIEGFFDVCNARGLTGKQGVLIPAANVKHLMLRQDVIDAAAAGKFHIYPVTTVDEGIEILTGLPAGTRDAAGKFPKGSINDKVEQRLVSFARQARAFRALPAESEEEEKE